MTSARITTRLIPALLDTQTADDLFAHLEKNIVWEDGIYSTKAKMVSRKAKALSSLDEKLYPVVLLALERFDVDVDKLADVYLNYYRNGKDFAPQHKHPGTTQIVISLGCPRTLNVAKRDFIMQNGDAIIFGSSMHGVVADPDCNEARISIAIFCRK